MTMSPASTHAEFPENAYFGPDGELYHKVTRMSEGGHLIESYRRLARTLEEARDKRIDYYDPSLGLIWEGYKLAKDRLTSSIIEETNPGGFRRANGSGPTMPGELGTSR